MEVMTVPVSQGWNRPCTCRWPTEYLVHTHTHDAHVRPTGSSVGRLLVERNVPFPLNQVRALQGSSA